MNLSEDLVELLGAVEMQAVDYRYRCRLPKAHILDVYLPPDEIERLTAALVAPDEKDDRPAQARLHHWFTARSMRLKPTTEIP